MPLHLVFFILTLAFVCGGLVWWQRRPPMIARRCLVTLKSDERHALSGVLWQVRGPWLVFRDCAMTDGQTRTAMSGEVIVDRRNVALVQTEFLNGGEQLR